MTYYPAVVAEWCMTLISQIQVENTVAQVPGSNPAWGMNMVTVIFKTDPLE